VGKGTDRQQELEHQKVVRKGVKYQKDTGKRSWPLLRVKKGYLKKRVRLGEEGATGRVDYKKPDIRKANRRL